LQNCTFCVFVTAVFHQQDNMESI